jgi:hypothetical protein
MPKTSSRKSGAAAPEIEPFDKRNVDLTRFKPDISARDWATLIDPTRIPVTPIFFLPIETLSPRKTVGLGRTNVTIIEPTIVQLDAATPYAAFDRRVSPARKPIIQIHFQPSGYGITTPGSYVIAFSVESGAQVTLSVQASAGPGTVSGTGTRTVSGQQVVSVVFRNMPASQQAYAYLEQTAGGQWSWYSTRISYPPIVIGA